jgi:hypothetical protein
MKTEAERLAGYKADMAATVAARGTTNGAPGPQIAGQGCLQTPDTARYLYQQAQRRAADPTKKLTPAEIVEFDYAGRQIARQKAALSGQTLTDNEIQRAGRAMVQSKADQKS